jgi:Apea-like HEPN
MLKYVYKNNDEWGVILQLKLKIHLPFKLPTIDGYKFVSGYDFADFITLFNTYTRVTVIDEMEEQFNQECTVVNITYVPKNEGIENMTHDDLLRQTVMDSIHYINKFLDVVRFEFGLVYINNITIADLPLILNIESDQDRWSYVTRPQDVTRQLPLITKKGMIRIGKTLSTWDHHPEIYLVDKYFDAAKSHLYKEQLIDAIIDLQTSFEIFIRNTHKLILLKNNAPEHEVKNASSIAFRNVIEHHLSKYLKTDLSFNKPGEINDWYKKLYKVRNEIVHQGRIYLTGNEAYEAYDAYELARNFICDRLNDEGYMTDGKVDLTLFKKNIKGEIDGEEIINRLKEKGLLEDHLEFKKV